MDGCKFYYFIYFAVAMGLVTRSRGNDNVTSIQGMNATDAVNKNEIPSTAKNDNNPEISASSGPVPSGSAPTSSVARTSRPSVPPKSMTGDADKNHVPLFLMILGVVAMLCVLLLVMVVVLACKVCYLRSQLWSSLCPQTNGAGPWTPSQGGKEVAGTGEAETSVMLEEVKLVKGDEETAQTGGAQEAADEEGNSGDGEAGPAKEPSSVPTAAASEPAPALNPEPDESPAPQTTPAPTTEPAPDMA